MSLITRCPTCETMFRVVPDQLRVSEGWVRCGQCAEVFDATLNMVPPLGTPADGTAPAAPQAPLAPPPNPTAPPSSPAATASSARAAPAHSAPPAPAPGAASPAEERAEASRAPAAPAQASDDRDWLDAAQTAVAPSDDAGAGSIDTLTPAHQDFPPTAPPNPADDVDPLSIPARDAGFGPPPSFLQDEPAPSIWQRPVVRLALAIVLVVLLALLAMQFLVKERDRVAAMHPSMLPVLETVCMMADCRIEPLRQIESIVIDSSSFSLVRGDDYRLGFSLKNTAPIDIAMPAIELSLTDPQDQPVIRRVILPTEFGARSAALASATIWTGSLALSVQPDIGAQRIAGYRLLAFYP